MESKSQTVLTESNFPGSSGEPAVSTNCTFSKENNFDLIRLIASIQVAVTHLANYSGVESRFISYLGYFPGVPVFFFISGFLIYQSFTSTIRTQRHYFAFNRVLRLYPGLFVCTLLTAVSIEMAGYHIFERQYIDDLARLIIAHGSIFQFYNPGFLREYGSGAINGSLWTIGVEVQFYVLTPLLFFLFSRYKNAAMVLLCIFLCANVANTHLNERQSIASQLIDYSFVPWFYMFLLGAFVSMHKEICIRITRWKFLHLLIPYCACYYLAETMQLGTGNSINPVCFMLLAIIIIKCAYSHPLLSDKLLQRNDISYGIYIYHMPIINYLIHTKATDSGNAFLIGAFLTLVISILSWFVIEKPFLRLKITPSRDMLSVNK